MSLFSEATCLSNIRSHSASRLGIGVGWGGRERRRGLKAQEKNVWRGASLPAKKRKATKVKKG